MTDLYPLRLTWDRGPMGPGWFIKFGQRTIHAGDRGKPKPDERNKRDTELMALLLLLQCHCR